MRVSHIISFLIFTLTYGCANTQNEESNGKDSMNSDAAIHGQNLDTLDYSSFSAEQALELNFVIDKWAVNYRNDIYKKYKVNHNCNDCESTSLQLELTIDKDGLVKGINVLSDRIFCLEEKAREALKNDMIASVKHEWKFSNDFALKVVQVRIGVVLKC